MKDFVIQIQFFTNCNLNCDFCIERTDYVRHDNIDLEFIKQIPYGIIRDYKNILQKIDTVNMGACGGEVFMDSLPDEIFDTYRDIVNTFNTLCKETYPNIKTIYWNWMSNLVFKNHSRVLKFIKNTKSNISTSYDSIGRFTSQYQKDLWLDNLNRFESYINSVSFVINERQISHMIDNNDIMLLKIPKNVMLDMSYYVSANTTYKSQAVSDECIFKFFKWSLDNRLFNCVQIQSAINTLINPSKVLPYCDCIKNNWYTNSIAVNNTCYADIPDEDRYNQEQWRYLKDKSFSERKLITDYFRGCDICEYNGNCQKLCYCMLNIDSYKITKICPLYKVYQYIENNPQIIDDFKSYLKEKNNYVSDERAAIQNF